MRDRIVRRRPPALLSAIAAAAALGLSALALSGCGYALVGRASNLPPDIKRVYLQPIANRTPRQKVDQELTRAIADELVKRQRFQVTSSREGADAEITGAVVAFGATPVTFDNTGRATEYEISLTASIVFKRTGNDSKVIWKNDQYTFRQSYPLDPTSATYFDRETEAIQNAAKRFAQTMVSDLLEGF
ncbi:MAG: LPS assembly lipoprotein LptE [Acidobacteriota bacterium]|nr:LPS assembly lipoprotein LptE [Acidobacteriota bacterium]